MGDEEQVRKQVKRASKLYVKVYVLLKQQQLPLPPGR
jgi:hypothetical protein